MLSKKLCSQFLDGNMTDHDKYMSGTCKGFHVTVNTTPNGLYSFQISAHSENDPGNAALRAFLEAHKNTAQQIQSYDVYPNSIRIVSTRTFLIKKVPAHLNEAILPIIDFLAGNGYVSGCMNCGTQEAPLDCYNINDTHHYLCSDCAAKVEGTLFVRQQEILLNKSKLLPGAVGALLGSLIGCAAYFLLWQLGYVAAIVGLITAVCSFKGYEMLGGVVDKKGVFVCIAMIIFAIFFANRLAWAYEVYDVYKDYGVDFFTCFRAVKDVIAESDLTGEYYGNLAFAYLFTIFGSFQSVRNAFKASTGSYKVKKMKD